MEASLSKEEMRKRRNADPATWRAIRVDDPFVWEVARWVGTRMSDLADHQLYDLYAYECRQRGRKPVPPS